MLSNQLSFDVLKHIFMSTPLRRPVAFYVGLTMDGVELDYNGYARQRISGFSSVGTEIVSNSAVVFPINIGEAVSFNGISIYESIEGGDAFVSTSTVYSKIGRLASLKFTRLVISNG